MSTSLTEGWSGSGRELWAPPPEMRQTVVVPDVSKDQRYVALNPETRSEMAIPLIYRGRVIGVADLESPQVNYFTEEHARIFSTLAPQIAIAIENARLYERVARSEARLERDLQRAQEIQMHLMPGTAPPSPGMRSGAALSARAGTGRRPLRFSELRERTHVLAVGDVSGKGAPAALYGAMASGILRSLAPQKLSPPDLLKRLSLVLLERKIEGHFITADLRHLGAANEDAAPRQCGNAFASSGAERVNAGRFAPRESLWVCWNTPNTRKYR